MECIKNIIGVTNTDCNCILSGLTPELKAQLKVSASGIYLEDLPGGIELKALNNLEACKNLANISLDALANAEKTTNDDLIVALANTYQKGQNTFKGFIGQQSYSSTLIPAKQFEYMTLRAVDGADAVAIVNRIMLIVNGAADLVLKVIKASRNSAVGVELYSLPVTVEANAYTFVTLPAPLTLPLSDRGQPVDYYFIYDRLGTSPKDNKIDCGCDQNKRRTIDGYIKVMGGETDSLDNLTGGTVDPKYTHGIILDVELRCNTEQLVCGNYDSQEAVAVTLARAVWYKAGELQIEAVFKSNEVNRYTTQNREYLWGKRNHFRSEYEARISYLADAIDITSSNCFICKDQALYLTTPVTILGTRDNVQEAIETSFNAWAGSKVPGVIPIPDNY